MLSTSDLRFSYKNGPSFQFPDIHCETGKHMLIIGESGKGKTTLLHLLAGLLRPTEGRIEVAGQRIGDFSNSALDVFRGKKIGIVFQTPHFISSLSVLENLLLPAFFTTRKAEQQKILEILSRLNLSNRLSSNPSDLSVGEQQRVAIARAIVNQPEIILADEPTSALDDRNAIEVIRLLEEQASLAGASLIIVTHDQRLKNHFHQHIGL